jgi:hypothetical protein
MSRMALWNMYNNTSPHNQSPPEVQQEALNLQRESPSPNPSALSPISIKRERSDHHNDINEYPPSKRGSNMNNNNLIRTNSDLMRKTSININNNHHHISNNNNNNNSNSNNNISHITPTKDINSKKSSQSPSPHQMQINTENGNHLQSPVRHHSNKHNGIDSLGTTMLNGMQFKIISKGTNFASFNIYLINY